MFRRYTCHRADDGIHWDGSMHRAITNMLLWHICHAWHVELPAPKSLLGVPPRHQQVPSLLNLNCKPSRPVRFSNECVHGFHGLQPTSHPVMHVDFTADNFNDNHLFNFERSQVPNLVNVNCKPSRPVQFSNECVRRFHGLQPNSHPVMHVDFTADNFNDNDFNFARQQIGFNFNQNWNSMRQFGSNLTNRARRGRCDLRNYRQRPY